MNNIKKIQNFLYGISDLLKNMNRTDKSKLLNNNDIIIEMINLIKNDNIDSSNDEFINIFNKMNEKQIPISELYNKIQNINLDNYFYANEKLNYIKD